MADSTAFAPLRHPATETGRIGICEATISIDEEVTAMRMVLLLSVGAFLGGVLGSGIGTAAEDEGEKKGTTTGNLTAKQPSPNTWIEVRADGEEKSRRYVLHFKGTPELLQAIKETPVGSRVKVEWIYVERLRVLKLETIAEPKKNDKPANTQSGDGVPTLSETLAWLKRVDGELRKPRYANLTLEQLKTLTELQLGGHRKSDNKHLFVQPAEFKHLTSLNGLKKLNLGENDGVADEALIHVGKLTGLTELILWDAPITDAGVRHLANLKELKNLDLAFATKITTAALVDIARLPKLEQLNLAGTKVDDVSALSSISALRELRIGKLRPAGLNDLKKVNPKLIVK